MKRVLPSFNHKERKTLRAFISFLSSEVLEAGNTVPMIGFGVFKPVRKKGVITLTTPPTLFDSTRVTFTPSRSTKRKLQSREYSYMPRTAECKRYAEAMGVTPTEVKRLLISLVNAVVTLEMREEEYLMIRGLGTFYIQNNGYTHCIRYSTANNLSRNNLKTKVQ